MTTITVHGEPTGKGRPRFGNGHTFTPKKTKEYEELVAWSYKEQHGEIFGETPIDLTIKAYFGIPQSKPLRFKRAAKVGMVFPTKKPDIDNIIKIIMDALNGVAYPDDKWIVSLSASKEYSETPRVEVTIKEHYDDTERTNS